jgi:hypothetical protein
MTSPPTDGDSLTLSYVSFFGRTFDECLEMYSLTEASLHGLRVLDCPSGPDSFVAESTARGLSVIGVDPLFSLPPEELFERARLHIADTCSKIKTASSAQLRDVDKFCRDKLTALARFSSDFVAGRADGRYIAASLPDLPFANRAFDVVLTANFLMAYAPSTHGGILETAAFDEAFHVRAVAELARVTARELRLSPTHAMSAPLREHPYLPAVRAELTKLGFTVKLVASTYDCGFGSSSTLVATRTEEDIIVLS